MLSNNIVFSNLIYQNYGSAKNIGELAEITNYSMSGFKKKFAKVFGVSPAVWVKREKAKKIYYEINCSLKTFKEISNEYNFSSPAQFNKFCKKMYNMPPGTLRKNNKKNILSG
jgi:AraC-like DNA-binding protein